jgi:hypothetical protein
MKVSSYKFERNNFIDNLFPDQNVCPHVRVPPSRIKGVSVRTEQERKYRPERSEVDEPRDKIDKKDK